MTFYGIDADQNKISEKEVVQNEEKLDSIDTRLEARPKKSIFVWTFECGLAKVLLTLINIVKLWPYKNTVVLRNKNTKLWAISGIGI